MTLDLAPAGCTPGPATRAIDPALAVGVATTLKALADPLRVRILSLISASPQGESCVCDMTELGDVSQPTVSHHLKVLRDAGVLTSERRGTWVWYRITERSRSAVTALLDSFAPTALDGAHGEPRGGLLDVDDVLTRLATELATQHPGLPRELVTAVTRESYAALARTATVSTHLVSLTERFARQRLADLGRDRAASRPQVLFVCVANAGRSQLAAALVAHYAGDRVVARSAGSTPAAQLHPSVRAVLDDLEIAPEAFPKPLTDDAVRAADVVITMGCGDVCPIVPGVRYLDWQVGDPALASVEGVEVIRADIDARVRELLSTLVPDLSIPTTPGSTTS